MKSFTDFIDKKNKNDTLTSNVMEKDEKLQSDTKFIDDDTEYVTEVVSEIYDGQYHEVNPGQYHEYNPGQYHEISSGQEVQLDIEFNPEDETKTYNVHKKTGEYIIGEVGKIDINNGQTLEGVRYTAVDSMVDQAQIAEILQRYFGTKTN